MATELPKVSKLTGPLWRILGCNPSKWTLQGTNNYLVGTGPTRILIDAGEKSFPEFLTNFKNLLVELKVRIDQIIITHWHKDHVGGLEEELIPIFKEFNDGQLPRVYKFNRTEDEDQKIPSEYPYEVLKNGQIFECQGATLQAIHTPGHTTDHAVIKFYQESALLCGDCLLGEGTGIFDDLYDYMNSLKIIEDLKVRRIYPGHGPVIEDAAKRIEYYKNHQLLRERRIIDLFEMTSGSLSTEEIVKKLYPSLSNDNKSQAIDAIEHHLKKLMREHRVQKQQDRYSYFIAFG